jgi:hypothetical protein
MPYEGQKATVTDKDGTATHYVYQDGDWILAEVSLLRERIAELEHKLSRVMTPYRPARKLLLDLAQSRPGGFSSEDNALDLLIQALEE